MIVLDFAFYPYCRTHTTQTSMLPAGFEPTIPAGERPQTKSLDRAAIRIGYTPHRPACSESLYRLSFRGPHIFSNRWTMSCSNWQIQCQERRRILVRAVVGCGNCMLWWVADIIVKMFTQRSSRKGCPLMWSTHAVADRRPGPTALWLIVVDQSAFRRRVWGNM